MADTRQSRSPVRAVTPPDRRALDTHAPLRRTWGEPSVRPRETAPTPVGVHLGCPECGTALQLQLSPRMATNPLDAAQDHAAPVDAPHPRPGAHPLRAAPEPIPDFGESIREFKRRLLTRALRENDGVMTRAAKAVGLKYTTFVAMVHRLEIST